jgi:hypothetical protein
MSKEATKRSKHNPGMSQDVEDEIVRRSKDGARKVSHAEMKKHFNAK